MSAPAKTQALEALVDAHARELHLPAIRARFRGLAAEAVREQQTPLAYLAALLEAETQERAERREKRRLLASIHRAAGVRGWICRDGRVTVGERGSAGCVSPGWWWSAFPRDGVVRVSRQG